MYYIIFTIYQSVKIYINLFHYYFIYIFMNLQNIKKENLVGIKRIENYSYALTDEIGRGYSSSVYKGKDDRTNQFYALKVVDMRKLQEVIEKELLKSQINCLKELKESLNIINLVNVIATANNTYMITQLCEGKDLAKLIRAKKILSEQEAVTIMKQIVNGYLEIHKNSIIHRDLKPANIFFKKGVVKIADFGFAIKAMNSNQYRQYNLGSPTYMSPQALKQNIYSYKSDIWALGVILFEMLNGRVPWKTKSDSTLYNKMLTEPIQTLISPQIRVSPYLIQFMKKCCCPRLQERMSPEQLSKFQWKITNQVQLIENSNYNQRRRSLSPNKFNTKQNDNNSSNKNNLISIQKGSNQLITQQEIKTPLFKVQQTPQIYKNNTKKLEINMNDDVNQKRNSLEKQNKTDQRSLKQKNITSQTSQLILEEYLPGTIENARNGILSQIHYCRFMYKILLELQTFEQNICRKQLIQLLKTELITKISMLAKTFKEQKNYFKLRGFQELIKCKQWSGLKELVFKYHQKYMKQYNMITSPIIYNDESIIKAIKFYKHHIKFAPFLDKLINLYEIKQLQRKIDYNDFNHKTKIELIVQCKTCLSYQRIKAKLNILAL